MESLAVCTRASPLPAVSEKVYESETASVMEIVMKVAVMVPVPWMVAVVDAEEDERKTIEPVALHIENVYPAFGVPVTDSEP